MHHKCIRDENQNYFHETFPPGMFPEPEIVLMCYDLPVESIADSGCKLSG